MNFIGQDYQAKQIKKHQKFLLKLLHLRIGNYYPLRKWLGIDHKGKIDEITNLSIAYNAKKVKKGYQITRTYQGKDLGYKLNLVLDKIPQLALLPALLQPAYGCLALAFFFLTQTTYQPSIIDTYINSDSATSNYGTVDYLNGCDVYRPLIHWDTTDIPADATFSQGDILLYQYSDAGAACTIYVNRLTRTDWVETEATWNIYKTGSNWTTAGGDYSTTNQVGVVCQYTGWKTWEAAALIQDCYDNQSKNVHILLYGSTGYNQPFRSREIADTTLRPKLTVTYSVPSTGNFFQLF